jgi:putative NADPH-quinone reductase
VGEVFNVGLAKEVLLASDDRTREDPSRQYGMGGKMQGKKFMVSATWNAPREAFDNSNGVLFGGKGTTDLFLHITSNYKFTSTTFSRILGCSISSRTPTSRSRLKTTSGIWRNIVC